MKVLFTSLVLLYLVFDLGDPNLPGAVSFDPDECIEVVQSDRAPSAPLPTVAVTPEPLFRLPRVQQSPLRVVAMARHGVAPPRAHALRPWPPDLSSEEG